MSRIADAIAALEGEKDIRALCRSLAREAGHEDAQHLAAVRNALSDLKRRGLVERTAVTWGLTDSGRHEAKRLRDRRLELKAAARAAGGAR